MSRSVEYHPDTGGYCIAVDGKFIGWPMKTYNEALYFLEKMEERETDKLRNKLESKPHSMSNKALRISRGNEMQSSNFEEAKAMRDAFTTEHERDAFTEGHAHAHGIACHNVPRIGKEYWTDSEGQLIADADNVRDIHAALCYEAELNARCYSPWEYTAARINALDEFEAEAAWEAYDAGVAAAIEHDLKGYTNDNYAIN